jgi:hypothetical protein
MKEKFSLKVLGRILLRVLINAGKFLAVFIPFLGVGFFCAFGVNLLFPEFIDKVGENTTLKYSLVALGIFLVATVGFILWTWARYRNGKKYSWWLTGGFVGFILGLMFPVAYMISRAASEYLLPDNPYWG